MSTGAQLLLVDDEEPIRITLGALLRRAGYDVTTASSGEDAVVLLQHQAYDVLIADLKMPGIDGMEVVRAAQARDPDTVCIILTGHGSLETAIEGLRRDIFDYLLKTSDPQEVLRRVREAVEQRDQIRRRKHMLQTLVSTATELGLPQRETVQPAPPLAEAQTSSQAEGSIIVGPLTIDPLRQEVTLEGRRVVLTPTEMRVLVCLARRAGTMLSYVELVQCVQGYDTFPAEAAELIKPHMHHLRQKLEPNAARPRYLLNVRGMGYLLSIDGEQVGT